VGLTRRARVDVTNDPVEQRRASIRRLVALGKRIGYGALLVAVVAFVVGAITSFPAWTVTVATIGLVVCCVALPGAIVFGYAVRAAEREERSGTQRP
jgi:hypothetical protein